MTKYKWQKNNNNFRILKWKQKIRLRIFWGLQLNGFCRQTCGFPLVLNIPSTHITHDQRSEISSNGTDWIVRYDFCCGACGTIIIIDRLLWHVYKPIKIPKYLLHAATTGPSSVLFTPTPVMYISINDDIHINLKVMIWLIDCESQTNRAMCHWITKPRKVNESATILPIVRFIRIVV